VGVGSEFAVKQQNAQFTHLSHHHQFKSWPNTNRVDLLPPVRVIKLNWSRSDNFQAFQWTSQNPTPTAPYDLPAFETSRRLPYSPQTTDTHSLLKKDISLAQGTHFPLSLLLLQTERDGDCREIRTRSSRQSLHPLGRMWDVVRLSET